jgi:hypothetical protein
MEHFDKLMASARSGDVEAGKQAVREWADELEMSFEDLCAALQQMVGIAISKVLAKTGKNA